MKKQTKHKPNLEATDHNGGSGDVSRTSVLRIYLAGGCFWSKEYHLSQVPGVLGTEVGFMGGTLPHPTYKQVCTKTTGHAEVVRVDYDPQQCSTQDLLIQFFSIHDPRIDRRGKGGQYRSAVFYTTSAQRTTAENLFAALQQKGHEIFTELQVAPTFWPAEERHQQFCETKGLTPRPTKGLLQDLETVRDLTQTAAE